MNINITRIMQKQRWEDSFQKEVSQKTMCTGRSLGWIFFWAIRELQFFFCCLFEKFGFQLQIWMFLGSLQDLSDGLEEPEGSAGKIRVEPA